MSVRYLPLLLTAGLALVACGAPASGQPATSEPATSAPATSEPATAPTTIPAVTAPPVATADPAVGTRVVATVQRTVTTAAGAGLNLVTVSGQIASLDADGLTVSTTPERVWLAPTTQIIVLQKPTLPSALSVGRFVEIVADRDQQGRLVAATISVVPPRLLRPPPPK